MHYAGVSSIECALQIVISGHSGCGQSIGAPSAICRKCLRSKCFLRSPRLWDGLRAEFENHVNLPEVENALCKQAFTWDRLWFGLAPCGFLIAIHTLRGDTSLLAPTEFPHKRFLPPAERRHRIGRFRLTFASVSGVRRRKGEERAKVPTAFVAQLTLRPSFRLCSPLRHNRQATEFVHKIDYALLLSVTRHFLRRPLCLARPAA